ncbi:hypothetical protein D3C84_1221170 [compost metagenome]
MAFSTDHAPLGLPRLGLKLRPLPFDPAELAHHGQAHGFVVNSQGRSDAHAPLRRINAQVQVFDRLTHDLNGQTAYRDVARLSIHADA